MDIGSEKLLTVAEACRLLPSHGTTGHVHAKTVYHWFAVGVEAPHGGRVKLESVKLGNRRYTTAAALARFAAAQTAAEPPPPPPTPAARRRAYLRAVAELKAAGI